MILFWFLLSSFISIDRTRVHGTVFREVIHLKSSEGKNKCKNNFILLDSNYRFKLNISLYFVNIKHRKLRPEVHSLVPKLLQGQVLMLSDFWHFRTKNHEASNI